MSYVFDLNATQKSSSRVVFYRPGAIGDVLMTLAFVKMYKAKHPGSVVIYQAAASIANALRPVMLEAGVDEVATTDDQVERNLQYNLLGYPFSQGYPHRPMAQHLLHYYSCELGLEGRYEDLRLKLPPRMTDQRYVTLHAKTGWSMYKDWPIDRWTWVVGELRRRGINVIQIGGSDQPVIEGIAGSGLGKPFVENLALLANADLHLGGDSWSNHATNVDWIGKGKTRGVILWGSTQVTGSGYPHNININLGLPCQPCFRENPGISRMPGGICPNPPGQSYEDVRHACMHGIDRERILHAILKSCQKPLPHSRILPSATYSPWLSDEQFKDTWKTIESHTLIDVFRGYELWQLAQHTRNLSGSILEVGVWRGGSGCLLAMAAPEKTVYLADAFTGTVKAGENDPDYRDGEHADASEEIVLALLAQNGVHNTILLKGIFPDDMGRAVEDQICLLHIDVDVYQSGRDIVAWALPRLVKGAVIVFDDYGFSRCGGITKLVNELRIELSGFLFIHNLNGHAIFVKTGHEGDWQVGTASCA